MQTPTEKLIEMIYDPCVFAALATHERNLRVEQVHMVRLREDGGEIRLLVTESGYRIAEKRAMGPGYVPPGFHAIVVYDRRNGSANAEFLISTAGIKDNPGLEQALAGIRTLLNRQGRNNLVCAAVADAHVYMRAQKTGACWVNLTNEIDAVEVAYMPGAKGYLARKADGRALGFLPVETTSEGIFRASAWRFVDVPGTKAVLSIPPRIQTARAVMVSAIDTESRPVAVTLDLTEIGVGTIYAPAEATQNTAPGLAFRGFSDGTTAVVENTTDREVHGLLPGANLVPTEALPSLFGNAARALIGLAISAG